MKTLALIGVGRWGKNILTTLEKIPEANLKYLCAQEIEAISSCGDSYEKMTDWRELLGKKDIDAVLIATPPETHYEIAKAFLENDVSVFVEKPMVLTLTDAVALKKLVEEKKSVCMVGYEYVYNDCIVYLKNEIERGVFGEIISFSSEHRVSPLRKDVDIFWDSAPHPLSVFGYLFGQRKIVSSTGTIGRDEASVKVIFENAPLLKIDCASFGDKKVRKMSLVGERGSAVLDETSMENKLSVTKDGETSYPEINVGEALKNELKHFLECLASGKTPTTNVDFGLSVTQWLETISKK